MNRGADRVDEFLPVVIEDGREIGQREHVNICSTYERAMETAASLAARARRTNPTARGAAAAPRRAVGNRRSGATYHSPMRQR
jgi:hypothetical protein